MQYICEMKVTRFNLTTIQQLLDCGNFFISVSSDENYYMVNGLRMDLYFRPNFLKIIRIEKELNQASIPFPTK